ncbi:DoxX family protein [Hymenobacter sp. AT01-02]|uniref:DoxX family protein n=1 Tax=Hymenobacter sp. AT01-02 TaxID=1571877 RepID=UPI0006981D1A|nr:DoxX family protein [Hymenobacter sp. AT01-02]
MSVKTKKILSWVLSGLLAVGFIGAGGSKLAGVPEQLQNLQSWGYPEWFRFPIGLSEIALGIGLLVPASRLLTLYAVFVWAAVAAITHLQAGQAAMLGGPVAFAVLALLNLLVWRSVASEQTKLA